MISPNCMMICSGCIDHLHLMAVLLLMALCAKSATKTTSLHSGKIGSKTPIGILDMIAIQSAPKINITTTAENATAEIKLILSIIGHVVVALDLVSSTATLVMNCQSMISSIIISKDLFA